MHVIGTAGHVDHGKSTLIKALTGINPDRLREEQVREMTIELGFAWLTLPGELEVGIVDVPGHRDFIDNMLAGVGGIDAVIFVIAADEGVMPQTREHLAILDLLQIPAGLVALTKCDLAPDRDWLNLVEEDIRSILAGTVLKDAPVVRVSARTGEGLENLQRKLSELLADVPTRPDLNRPRLSVDRVFTLSGFGTVVTGTLQDGSLRTGEEVVVLPQNIKGRIRGLQTHKRKADLVQPGSRTAVNISGIDLSQVKRGDVLAQPGKYQPDGRMDASLRVIQDASIGLAHNQEVKFYLGAAETLARIRVLGQEKISPGENGWIQLEFDEPVVAARGDRFILRRPSPGETLGGGIILDPHPGKRHKRFQADIIKHLEVLAEGNPEDLLYQAALSAGLTTRKKVAERVKIDKDLLATAFSHLQEEGRLIFINDSSSGDEPLVAADNVLLRLCGIMETELKQFHAAYPLRQGMPREELKSRLKLNQKEFNTLMSWWLASSAVKADTSRVSLPGFEVVFTPEQEKKRSFLLKQLLESPYSPPGLKDCMNIAGTDLVIALIEKGTLVKVSDEVVFTRQAFDSMKEWVKDAINKDGAVTVVSFRDHFETSRKYALALLEYLDATGFTVRDGDYRRLRE